MVEAAALLEDEPTLMATTNTTNAEYSALYAGAGYLDVFAAVTGPSTQSASTGVEVSHLLWTQLEQRIQGRISLLLSYIMRSD